MVTGLDATEAVAEQVLAVALAAVMVVAATAVVAMAAATVAMAAAAAATVAAAGDVRYLSPDNLKRIQKNRERNESSLRSLFLL